MRLCILFEKRQPGSNISATIEQDMQTLRRLSAAGHDTINPDILKETADSVIQSQDMESIFEEARQNYNTEQ